MAAPNRTQDPFAALPFIVFMICQTVGMGAVSSTPGRIHIYIAWLGAGLSTTLLLYGLCWMLRARPWPWRILPTVIAALAFAVLAHPMLGVPWTRVIESCLRWSIFGLGMVLLTYGIGSRVNSGPRCAHCGYERGDALEIPDQCPECGRQWTSRGGMVEFRVVRRPWMITTGAALCALICLSMLWPIVGSSSLARAIPTPILLAQAASSTFISNDQWLEIARRNAPADDVALSLLDYRLRGGFLPDKAQVWLDAQVTGRAISPKLIERFYAEWDNLILRSPDRGKVGQSITIEVASNRPGYSPTAMSAVAISGVWIADDPSPITRSFSFVPPGGRGRNGESASATFTRSEPGPARVRVGVWIIIGPSTVFSATPAWNPDGSLSPPPGVLWHKYVELTTTVRVDP